jgi:hypothetical protein
VIALYPSEVLGGSLLLSDIMCPMSPAKTSLLNSALLKIGHQNIDAYLEDLTTIGFHFFLRDISISIFVPFNKF